MSLPEADRELLERERDLLLDTLRMFNAQGVANGPGMNWLFMLLGCNTLRLTVDSAMPPHVRTQIQNHMRSIAEQHARGCGGTA